MKSSYSAGGGECLNYVYLVWVYFLFYLGAGYPAHYYPYIISALLDSVPVECGGTAAQVDAGLVGCVTGVTDCGQGSGAGPGLSSALSLLSAGQLQQQQPVVQLGPGQSLAGPGKGWALEPFTNLLFSY